MDSATQLVIGKLDAPIDGESFQASRSYRYYVAWLLCAVYAVNMMDRQLLSVLLEPIKREFALSDTAMGLLGGMAFALFYSTLGMPIARYADRGSRNAIIALSILVWSVFTTLTGFARGVAHLLAARVGVAIGEAGCNPAAYSLLGDYFPPERRGTALAIYQMGANIGAFVGLLCGGFIAESYGWRTAFLLVGIPGVGLALLVKLTLREPPRGFSDAVPLVLDPPPALQVLRGLYFQRHGSDATRASADGLRYALSIVSLVNVWSAAHYFVAARNLRRDAVLDHPAPPGHIA